MTIDGTLGDADRHAIVHLYPTLALVPRHLVDMLGDYERCMAWAWLESGVSQSRPQ